MAGGADKYHFRVTGDALRLSNTDDDFRTMIGGQLVTPPARNATMLVLLRQKQGCLMPANSYRRFLVVL